MAQQTDAEGFGPVATVEMSKEELLDTKSALLEKAWSLEDDGLDGYAEDMFARAEKMSAIIDDMEQQSN